MIKIHLDSNVFRDIDFIDWLQKNSDNFEIKLSIIAALETYHWYNLREIQMRLFKQELGALNAQVSTIKAEDIYKISDIAKLSKLPFKHHARDFIIGTQAYLDKAKLITFNIKHFLWLEEDILNSG